MPLKNIRNRKAKSRKRQVTLKDLAVRSKVNISTVSRVLNNTAKISDKVRRKVLNMSKRMGYYPNTIARALITKKSHTIGLVLPDFIFFAGGFFQEVVVGIEIELSKKRYNLLLTKLSGGSQNDLLHTIHSGMIDGALVLGDILTSADIEMLAGLNIPLVIINREIAEQILSFVCADNRAGGYLAGRHLIEHGYESFLFVGGGKDMPVTREREGGFRDAISEFKSISDLQTCYCHYNTALESSYDAIKEMHPDFTKRTGIFTASDHIAYGVMKYVLENRYKIGDQVGIIGYDNLETDAFTTVPLSSIEQKGRLMGESACKLLFEKIENKSEIGSLILKPELIRRKSCGC